MKKERLIFFIMFIVCISGFTFGVYYGDEIHVYMQNTMADSEINIGDMTKAFLNFYYDSAKLQILIFLCSFTVFSAPVGAFIILYSSIALGSSASVMTEFYASSGYVLYLSVLSYTLTGAISLYIYIEMICRAYRYSVSARHITGLGELTMSRDTRSYISGLLLLSVFILIAEICRFFIIKIFN